MKKATVTLITIGTIIIAACSSSKKSTKSAPAPAPVTAAPSTGTTYTPSWAKPINGIYAPGIDELTAIQAQFRDATLDQLKEGHAIYAQGACIRCHGTANIYEIDDNRWENILNNMALKAKITDAQKDAVNKYVLAIKAAQPGK